MSFGNIDETESKTCSIWQSFFTVMEIANHSMILLVTGYILYLAGGKLTATHVHAGLLTVGYVLLMSEAIFALAGESLLTRKLTRRVVSHLHWVAQCLGAAFSIAGCVLIYQVKKEHFTSIHGILGLTSLVIMCVLGFSGVLVVYATSLRNLLRPVVAKFVHNFLGISCFVIGMTAQCYGYQKKWMTGDGREGIATACTVVTALIIILSLFSALRSLRRQFLGTFA